MKQICTIFQNLELEIPSEKWADIPGCCGLYQASSLGRIRKPKITTVTMIDDRVAFTECEDAHIIPQVITEDGYLHCSVSIDGKMKSIGTHRLVAQAFKLHDAEQTEVHHIDRNPTNNAAYNLKWVSPAEHREYHRKRGIMHEYCHVIH
jgi:hypothetical protein